MPETRIVAVLRDYEQRMKAVLVLSLASILLLLVSLTAVRPGTTTEALVYLQLATFAVLAVLMVALLVAVNRS